MNVEAYARSSNEISGRIWVRLGAGGVPFLFSLINIWATAFAVPQFRLIYQETIHGLSLPSLTEGLLEFQTWWICLACLWLALGIGAILIPKNLRTSLSISLLLLIIIALQIGVTVVAPFLPMTGGPISGLPQSP